MPFPETEMIQALAIARDGRRHLIAGGTTNRSPTIYVWVKEVTGSVSFEIVWKLTYHRILIA
jgi:DNA integrity scanning protein DisA with diadenylate cyclase activity